MKSKKTTVNLSGENYEKVRRIVDEEGMTQSDVINRAIANLPIVFLGNRRTLATSFFEIRCLLENEKNSEVREEVEKVCRLLNSLMQKIEELTR